jgi:hypothetical protein
MTLNMHLHGLVQTICRMSKYLHSPASSSLYVIRTSNLISSLELTLKVLARKALHRKNTKEPHGPN